MCIQEARNAYGMAEVLTGWVKWIRVWRSAQRLTDVQNGRKACTQATQKCTQTTTGAHRTTGSTPLRPNRNAHPDTRLCARVDYPIIIVTHSLDFPVSLDKTTQSAGLLIWISLPLAKLKRRAVNPPKNLRGFTLWLQWNPLFDFFFFRLILESCRSNER